MTRIARASLRLVDLTGDPPSEVLLFRSGMNRSYKGLLLFDEEAARRVLADVKEHGAELFFDYDHASLYGFSKGSGEAAAWFTLEVKDGELWAVNVRWTEEAAEKVRARKYRYISPAVDYETNSNRITRLINVALTNLPASHGLPPLMAASQGENRMLEGALAHIATELGLDPDKASEDEVIKAFDDRLAGLGDEDEAEDAPEGSGEALAQLRALTGKATAREALAAAASELKAAREAAAEEEIRSLVDHGVALKRIPPESRERFVKLGRRDLDALRELVGELEGDPKPSGDKPDKPDKPAKREAKPARPSPPTVRHQQATLSARTRPAGDFDLAVARVLNIDPSAMGGEED